MGADMADSSMSERATLREAVDIEARRYLKRLFEDCDWNIDEAAKVAGICRATAYRYLYRLNIKKPYTPNTIYDRRYVLVKKMRDGTLA